MVENLERKAKAIDLQPEQNFHEIAIMNLLRSWENMRHQDHQVWHKQQHKNHHGKHQQVQLQVQLKLRRQQLEAQASFAFLDCYDLCVRVCHLWLHFFQTQFRFNDVRRKYT